MDTRSAPILYKRQPCSVAARVFTLLLALFLAIIASCKRERYEATEPASDKPYPEGMAQVEPLRKSGVTWTNKEIRAHYLKLVAAIGPANEGWKKEGIAAEERAKRAYKLRHDARVTCRAMMSDPADVEALERRDLEKYGHRDGPTFDELALRNQQKGRTGDAVYEAIIESAQRTSEISNEMNGARD